MAITGRGSDPTHHILLSDGKNRVGIILTNSKGERSEQVFKRFPKTDPVQVYLTETQSDWAGGMSERNFEDDRSAFWKGRGVDGLKSGVIVLGPQATYASGYRSADTHFPTGSFGWRKILASTQRYLAVKFTASASYSANYVKFWGRCIGRGGTLRVSIYSNSAGAPDAELGYTTVNSTVDDASVVRATFGTPVSLTASTVYWIVFRGQTWNDRDNHWEIGSDTSSGMGAKSTNGTAWTGTNNHLFYRVTAADVPFVPHFFEYKGQLYAALEYDNNGVTDLYMNGWRGAADSNTGDKTNLEDSTQSWTTDELDGMIVRMVGGPTSAETQDWREITGNDSNSAYCDADWEIAHTTYDDYVILGSDKWTKITPHASFAGRIKDLAVANSIVYMCSENNGYVWAHREYNNNGVWKAGYDAAAPSDTWFRTSTKAHFVEAFNDPVHGPVLWFGLNPGQYGKHKPLAWMGYALGWEDTLLGRQPFVTAVDVWTAGSSAVTVTPKYVTGGEVSIEIPVTAIKSVTGITAGGSGYNVGDQLYVTADSHKEGALNTAIVQVATLSGSAVATVTVVKKGSGYTSGTGKTTAKKTGSGTGCTLNLAAGDISTASGLLAYVNLVATEDIRPGKKIAIAIYSDNALSAGDLEFAFDDDTNCATPILEVAIPQVVTGKWQWVDMSYNASATAGADQVASVGIQLAGTLTTTTTITVKGELYTYDRSKPIEIGLDGDNITGLEIYGDPEGAWVFTETGFGELRNNLYLPVPMRELRVARHPANGKAHTVSDVYLMFSWRGRLQRYFRQQLEDLGPDYPQGMGAIRGQIVDVVSYPGRIYVAVDGGSGAASQVLCYKGAGWHEVYTSAIGERIRSLYIQAIPGKSDRLWVGVGADIIWLPLTLDPSELPGDSDYKFRPEGYLESAWINNRQDLAKLFKSVAVFCENLSDTQVDVQVCIDEGVGEGTNWDTIGTSVDSGEAEYNVDDGKPPKNIKGNRMKIRLRLRGATATSTPKVTRTTAKFYAVPDVKFSYNFLAKLSTISINLRGDEEQVAGGYSTVRDALDQLDAWASSLTPLIVGSNISAIDQKVVVMQPVPSQSLLLISDEKIEEATVLFTLDDI